MKIARTDRFKRAYKKLVERDRRRAEKALYLLVNNLSHPSLRVKKIRRTQRIWEATVTPKIRITFEIQEDMLILRNVGEHDKTLNNP